jgi:hypothetical protein
MKKIDTLVQDIYDVVDKGAFEEDAEHIDQMAKEIGEQLKRRLIANKDEEHRGLRLSSIGQCERKIWYQYKGYGGEKIGPATRIKFIFGDLLEALVICLSKMAGHEVRGEQDEVTVNGVLGHRDCVIDGHVVDIKSASKYGFQKFASGTVAEDDSFGYIDQLSAYVHGSDDVDKSSAYNLAIAKELGRLALFKLESKDMKDSEARVQYLKEVVTKDIPPNRPYELEPHNKKGNLKLGVSCSYCPFKAECYKDANDGAGLRTFLYSGRPVFLAKVVDEPRVEELL